MNRRTSVLPRQGLLLDDVESGFRRMVEHHVLRVLLGQEPCHPDVTGGCGDENDAPNQQRQARNEEGNDLAL